MTKSALFVQKFDLGYTVDLKILPANNNLDSVGDKAGLADGHREEKVDRKVSNTKDKKKKKKSYYNTTIT